LLVRAAFALGGLGSGFAEDEAQLRDQCSKVLTPCTITLIYTFVAPTLGTVLPE